MHAPAPAPPAADKRQVILAAARRLIARSGLHNTPMSALAREAGVAAGTLYRYFPGKEAMINALYLELLEDQHRATLADGAPEPAAPTPRDSFWRAWHGLARWHLDRPDASSVLQQCRASGILTDETRAAEQRLEAEGSARLGEMVARGSRRTLSPQVFHALFAGPIAVLAQMRETGEIEATDAMLRATFDGVCRSVLPPSDAAAG